MFTRSRRGNSKIENYDTWIKSRLKMIDDVPQKSQESSSSKNDAPEEVIFKDNDSSSLIIEEIKEEFDLDFDDNKICLEGYWVCEVESEDEELQFTETDNTVQPCHLLLNKSTCPVCKVSYKSRQNLMKHMELKHRDVKTWQCNICSKSFPLTYFIHIHMVSSENDVPHKCNICNKLFPSKKSLSSHQKFHENDKHLDDLFKEKPTLATACGEYSQLHGLGKKYECTICRKKYLYKPAFEAHMRIHNGKRPYECKICFKSFIIRPLFNKHMYSHSNEDLPECTVCFRKFSKRDKLESHMKIHNNERQYECAICDLKFCYRNSLVRHMQTLAHKVSINKSKEENSDFEVIVP